MYNKFKLDRRISEVIKMKEKEEVKELYNKLTDENKQVVNLIAKGMIVAQENVKKEVKQALS